MKDRMSLKTNVHLALMILISVASTGLVIESISEGWEFWVPPLLIVGLIASWGMHLFQYSTVDFRENFYFVFAALATLFHGVHGTSFFDLVVVSSLVLVSFSMINKNAYLNCILLEFFSLIILNLFMAIRGKTIEFNSLVISRLILHIVVELCVYYVCIQVIRQRENYAAIIEENEDERKIAEKDTDDFLVNISHELRTPVNVINGLTTLILQKEDRDDIASVRDAGLRLARQIEDIQDYTDIQRQEIPLEEEKYMITSLINDILVGISGYINQDKLEFIIDLNPNVPTMMKGDVKKLHKIIRHLLDNALQFTRLGGVYLKIDATRREYGVNLNIAVSDTGIGMTRKEVDSASRGLYQANKTRNRSTGGIGIGLNIVYGFVRRMGGFVQIQSEKGRGTTVSVSVPQEVINPEQCLYIDQKIVRNIVFYVRGEKFKVPQLREFYAAMALNFAAAHKQNLYSVNGIKELKKLLEKKNITHIFTGSEEYSEIPFFFDRLVDEGIVVAVSANPGFKANLGSRVIVMQKPLYGYPIAKILNGEISSGVVGTDLLVEKPEFNGLRALVVDDEPMNLVVATGIMKNYKIVTETAGSGKESLQKITENNYDVVFMDHMMPEMDGVEAMKAIKQIARDSGTDIKVIALTANAVAGAREMFIREGFDGFISKPIIINDFEKVMMKVLPNFISNDKRGGKA